MTDGAQPQAIELFPGREGLLSFGQKRFTSARVLDRKIECKNDVIGLVLNNGKRLCGSRDQKVAVHNNKITRFTPMADVAIGDRLRGEVAGMPVTVTVIGLVFYPRKDVRLVELELDHGKNFVAEGVFCR